MAGSLIQILTEQQAVDRISETLRRAGPGDAPFVLVLGAGFSQGLVSTARELVLETLPLWIESLGGSESFDALKHRVKPDDSAAIAAAFWKQFADRNRHYGLDLALDGRGLPQDIAAAYQAAFDPRHDGGVGAPSEARAFQRALMRLDQPRLNAPHFLLASILGVQPGKPLDVRIGQTRKNELFTTRAALTRLILTTNFDPFLQIALQSVNRLYFMSDTPDLGLGDDIFDDATDAIHLVYVHGSIHRRAQKATEADITAIKERNARILAPVLKRHGIIVLGYSGWDDVIVDALAACESFDHRLYWCGRKPDPSAKGAFGNRVPEVLCRPSASYVHIESAGQFMARLTTSLIRGGPRLFDNPIAQLREMLEVIDLNEFGIVTPSPPAGSVVTNLDAIGVDQNVMVQAQKTAIQRLMQMEALFIGGQTLTAATGGTTASVRVGAEVTQANGAMAAVRGIEWALSAIDMAAALGNHNEVLRLSGEARVIADMEARQRTHLLLQRGLARFNLSDLGGAVEDWGAAASVPEAPVDHVALALTNRGIAWFQKGDIDEAIADFTRVIEAWPGAPVDQVARALTSRAVAWDEKRDLDRAIADYTRVIDTLPGASVERVGEALYNRGLAWSQKRDVDREIIDYTRLIETLPGASVEQIVAALYDRGVAWGMKGDIDRAIADYTRVIDAVPGAPLEQVAKALCNRGIAWGQKGDVEQAIADYTRLIETPGAPMEPFAKALCNRGIAWAQRGETEKAIADYTRVIDAMRGAPAEQVAQALLARGVAWYQTGDADREMADFTRLIETLPGAPVQHVATAYVCRSRLFYEGGDFDRFLADAQAGFEKNAIDVAWFNLGLALLANGRDVEALDVYRTASEKHPTKVHELGVNDLEKAAERWLSADRARPVVQLLRSSIAAPG